MYAYTRVHVHKIHVFLCNRSVLEKCPLLYIKDRDKNDQPVGKGDQEDTEEIFTEHQSPSLTECQGIKPSDLTVCVHMLGILKQYTTICMYMYFITCT